MSYSIKPPQIIVSTRVFEVPKAEEQPKLVSLFEETINSQTADAMPFSLNSAVHLGLTAAFINELHV